MSATETVPEEAEIVNGEAEDITPADAPTEPAPSTDIATRPTTCILMPLAEPAEVKAAMVAYQRTLDNILDPTDWQGRQGSKGSFVKKSGWRKISKAFGLSVTVLRDRVERDEDGIVVRAEALVRASAPNGQHFDGDGYCSADEPRFADAKGRQKLENDLRATATTRAMNRAISSLVGFGEVSADEVNPGDGMAGQEFPEWAKHIDRDGPQIKAFRKSLGVLLGADADRCQSVFATTWEANGGGIPAGFVSCMVALAGQFTAKQGDPS